MTTEIPARLILPDPHVGPTGVQVTLTTPVTANDIVRYTDQQDYTISQVTVVLNNGPFGDAWEEDHRVINV